MSNPYNTQTISNYNTSPPADDASAVASNQLFWSKHKDKLADPIKTLTEAINTELLAAFAQMPLNQKRAISANDTQVAADERKLISATGAITYTLLPAVTAGDGFTCAVLDDGTANVTIDADGSELINGAATLVLTPGNVVVLRCDSVGWDIVSLYESIFRLKDGSELTIATGSITPTSNYHRVDTQADASSDDLTDIVTTNIPDGGMLLLRADSASRTVVVKHTASGANKIVTADSQDVTLDNNVKSLLLQRRGTLWHQATLDAGPGRLIGFQRFTASGTYTPTAGTNSVFVSVRGAGGGGGGADAAGASDATAAGGGGQGVLRKGRVTSLGATETVTINAGGTAGSTAGSNGGDGGTSVFGAHITSGGGGGGFGTGSAAAAGTFVLGGFGGFGGSGGSHTIRGEAGHCGVASATVSIGGNGGGEAGGRGGNQATVAIAGVSGGGGGGGATTTTTGRAGFVGGDGYVEIWEYS